MVVVVAIVVVVVVVVVETAVVSVLIVVAVVVVVVVVVAAVDAGVWVVSVEGVAAVGLRCVDAVTLPAAIVVTSKYHIDEEREGACVCESEI